MIIDRIKIYCRAGAGGSGCSSSLCLSSTRMIGGGGDGGDGGNVVLQVSGHPYDLSVFRGKKKFVAQVGGRGGQNNKKGANAKDLILNVPKGTLVRDLEENIIFDLTEKDKFLLCSGGRGGEGNYKKNYTIPPKYGEEREVTLDYRIPSSVVIAGLPNSGKTSLFNKLTGKNFKVAEYPFTTTSCIWAKAERNFKEFTIMDTPPLKKSKNTSHQANRFLKHFYRAKIILFLSDNIETAEDDFDALEREIALFDESFLEAKKLFYLLSKVDKIDKVNQKNIIPISAQKGNGIEDLKEKILENL
ncbi:MAG: hypothetical protein GY858_03260 [Candidatus Omnitrophica bacterium]|nr:hypothetical protein [Candidatus Omnitrophota bacterium]